MGIRLKDQKGALNMCVFCGGKLQETTTDYVEKIDNYVIVIKNVPCEKCHQCGEEYFSDEVSQNIELILDTVQKISSEITVTVIDYSNRAA